MNHSYDVVAVEFPIVYTVDGDHDPDGLLYTLKCYLPLLDWARARWLDGDRLLPRLHERRQHIQLVADGLGRYEQMRERLAAGPEQNRHLLNEYGRREENGSEPGCCEGAGPRSAAIRQNYRQTLDEVLAALGLLTEGAVTQLSPDPATRAAGRREWQAGLVDVDAAIAEWFALMEADDTRRFDPATLAAQSGLPPERVARLLLNDHAGDVTGLREHTPHYDRFNPVRPIPLVRPLVLRAARGDVLDVRLTNHVRGRRVGLHLQGEGIGGVSGGVDVPGVRWGDGADVGRNPNSTAGPSTTAGPGPSRRFRWTCDTEGVWPFNDLADVRSGPSGSNVHGLFGALVVEPPGAIWRDPETGIQLTGEAFADGPTVDVIMPGEDPSDPAHGPFVDFHRDDVPRSYREFTVFIHDEPEVHSGQHVTGEHAVMPLSYRAEPMANRLPHRMRRYAESTSPQPPAGQVGVDSSAVRIEIDDELNEVFWTARTPEGVFLERVSGEEQHHSSWLFGDPWTPILRNYRGDPARVRLVHAGMKETHVFHLHVHQWRAVPQDTARPSEWRPGQPRGSQLLDSITIGPQTGITIDPLYGSGSRQHLFGDVIWHCHLYPHFHHGMWGLWRSFDCEVDGTIAYPDGTPSHSLVPLPGRPARKPTLEHPGFPWFMAARYPQKSPPPPAIRDADVGGRRRLLQLPNHSPREWEAFPAGVRANPQSGALFVDLDGDALRWNAEAGLPPPRIVSYDVELAEDDVRYNAQGWHDPHGHHYRISGIEVRQLDAAGGVVDVVRHEPPAHDIEPFFPRANHGDIVELRLHNTLTTIPADDFDLTTLPVECGLHVHLVKFDVLAADGSSTGWNYLSGASCAEAVLPDVAGQPAGNIGLHRWVVDEEFGPCFFHDHLLANYRQKHGLFAALIAQPHGSQWHRPDQATPAWSGPEAVVVPPVASGIAPYREACLAVGDFVPLYEGARPLNPPSELSGDDDPGAMAVNFRCSPLTFRGDDPSRWFETSGGDLDADLNADPDADLAADPAAPPVTHGDPDTPVIATYPGERLRIRLVQGSHEEQHSFSMHGLRWRKEWHNAASRLVSQQTLGISEAFTIELGVPVHGPLPADPAGGGAADPYSSRYGPGDHLWQFAALDDLWLGCWGLVRALQPAPAQLAAFPPLPDLWNPPAQALERLVTARATPPRPHRLADGSWSAPVREHIVVARRAEHQFAGTHLTDPWGLVFAPADAVTFPVPADGDPVVPVVTGAGPGDEPLVLRARR